MTTRLPFPRAPHFRVRLQDVPQELRLLPGFRAWSSEARIPLNLAGLGLIPFAKLGELRDRIPTTPPALRPETVEILTRYQRTALATLTTLGSGALYHPCGSGKTLTAIAAIGAAPTIVVTRALQRIGWRRQVLSWSTRTASILDGLDTSVTAEAVDACCRGGEILIVGWETIRAHGPVIAQTCVARGFAPTVVYDEIHTGKSPRRFEANVAEDGSIAFAARDNMTAGAYALSVVAGRRIGLTATPVKDRLRDLWAQLTLLDPQGWGSYGQWAKRYLGARPGAYGGLDDRGVNENALPELLSRVQVVSHRVTQEEAMADLPPKRRELRVVTLEEQKGLTRLAGTRTAEMRAEGGTNLLELRTAAAAVLKERVALSIVDDCVESGQRVVVAAGRRKDAERWVAKIREKWPSVFAELADGGLDVGARQDVIDRYRALERGTPGVIVGTLGAIGEALDGLQVTDRALTAALPWTPGQIEQWEGRFLRRGSTTGVLITYLLAEGTFDDAVMDAVLPKLRVSSSVVPGSGIAGVDAVLSDVGDDAEIERGLLAKLNAEE